MQALDGVGRVDNLSHLGGIGEKLDHVVPLPFPNHRAGRVFPAPWPLGKSFQGGQGFFSRLGPIDRFESSHNRVTVFPAGVLQGITNQVNHAGPNLGMGKPRGDRLGKPFESIDHRNQYVRDPTVFDLGDHSEAELRSLALLDPDAQYVFSSVGQHAQC